MDVAERIFFRDARNGGQREAEQQRHRAVLCTARDRRQAGQRKRNQQYIKQAMVPDRQEPLPLGEVRRVGRRLVHQSHRQANERQDQDQRTQCLVPGE